MQSAPAMRHRRFMRCSFDLVSRCGQRAAQRFPAGSAGFPVWSGNWAALPARCQAICCCIERNTCCIFCNIPAKEILAAISEFEAAGWRAQVASGRAHADARAYCPGGPDGCPRLTIYGTPRVPEHETTKILRSLARCGHAKGK